jgi:hypothetical protein
MKIGFLIPCTSHGRDWDKMTETYLYKLTIKTFLIHQDKEHEYVFYLGVDDDDAIFNNPAEQKALINLKRVFKNIDFRFIVLNEKKGYLTKMWNKLFREAYGDGCDYFYQCGDDIEFKTDGWVNDCIDVLIQNHDVGLTGPINNNNYILTQAFVSRLHMEIFGFFFPENIINWGCDDWYNHVYSPHYIYPLSNHLCNNLGGKPRYVINYNPFFMKNYKENVDKLRNDMIEQGKNDRVVVQRFIQKYDLN